MNANFKYVQEIKFRLYDKTFKNVYYDRFNSIFKGFYIVASSDDLKNNQAYKIDSTERFGQQDIELITKVGQIELKDEQKKDIGKLNAIIATYPENLKRITMGVFK
jgi:hypothetical protein